MPYCIFLDFAWPIPVIFPSLIVKGVVSGDFIVFMYVNRFQKCHRKILLMLVSIQPFPLLNLILNLPLCLLNTVGNLFLLNFIILGFEI